MKKYFCDLCGKEITDTYRKRVEFLLPIGAELRIMPTSTGEIICGTQKCLICEKCSDRIVELCDELASQD